MNSFWYLLFTIISFILATAIAVIVSRDCNGEWVCILGGSLFALACVSVGSVYLYLWVKERKGKNGY